MCLQDDGLDPSHYVLVFNNLLYKSSEVEFKLITDMDEYLMVENGIFGGITMDDTKGNPIGKSVYLKPKMYSVLPVGHNPKTPDDSENSKKKHGIQKAKETIHHKDIELAQVKVIKTALRKGKKYDNLMKNYGNYLKKL
ncbi:hypothetical protein RhiirA4_421933 [Rhizophagus irregularis]|uniref:Uncharacterized protein n=1 Tax=Rhizophagus irregularis TaxID=588596 RepID=A0A2I1GND0_9GLOM|nr:hypothetical protein RhiirA4_421933 [Rhizophagus irregularis]